MNYYRNLMCSFSSLTGFWKFLLCLLKNTTDRAEFIKLSSKTHQIEMQNIRKAALMNFDDKIRVLNCGVHTKKYSEELSTEIKTDFCIICDI